MPTRLIFIALVVVATPCILHAGPFAEDAVKMIRGADPLFASLVAAKPAIESTLRTNNKLNNEDIERIMLDDIRAITMMQRGVETAVQRSIERDAMGEDVKRYKSDMRLIIATAWYQLRLDNPDSAFNSPKFVAIASRLRYTVIESHPEGARITIEAGNRTWKWDETQDDGYLPEGAITIHLRKIGFRSHAAEERIRGPVNKFAYDLQRE